MTPRDFNWLDTVRQESATVTVPMVSASHHHLGLINIYLAVNRFQQTTTLHRAYTLRASSADQLAWLGTAVYHLHIDDDRHRDWK